MHKPLITGYVYKVVHYQFNHLVQRDSKTFNFVPEKFLMGE
jgi:hypothetical protein